MDSLSIESHPFKPVYDADSKVLVLGSFPSQASRKDGFYYAHPTNRFWKVICKITGGEVPTTIEEKKKLLYSNNIALWDVVFSCCVKASSDSSITDIVPVDLAPVIDGSSISKVLCNGALSYKLYRKYFQSSHKIAAFKLPSTSAANARMSLEELAIIWEKAFAQNQKLHSF
ncbi:MAG: DNA-deoxyinosine glycosylase [Eubacteriaceae bacterium]|nr:DNA-deoxyinosine glycosylase [Eubacteriaceae bacterium]